MSRKPSIFGRRVAGGGGIWGLFHPKSRISPPLISVVLVFLVLSTTICLFWFIIYIWKNHCDIHLLTENFSSVFYSAQLTFYTKGFFVVILSGSNPCYWLSISRFRCIFSDILIHMILSSYLMQNFIVRA